MNSNIIVHNIKNISLGLLLAAILMIPGTVSAQAETDAQTLEGQISILKDKLNELVFMLQARTNYYAGTDSALVVDEETSKWFFVRQSADNDSRIFGDFDASLVIEADGGTLQLLIETDCSEGGLLLGDTSTCLDHQWYTASELHNGVRTYTIPMKVLTDSEVEQFSVSVRACRFNGCDEGIVVPINYKQAQTFGDTVEIYDRYEWEYEWDGDQYHVQEVLLSFPHHEVKKIKTRVRCDVTGLFTDPQEEHRLGCSTREQFTAPDYQDTRVDEEGNIYNLLLESVSRNFSADDVGKIEMEFVFFGKTNSVIHTAYHRPVQLETGDLTDEN